SDNSFDGVDSCAKLCEGCINNGGIAIAITDHLDIDDPELDVDEFVKNQFEDTLNAKIDFKGKLAVLQGIELGQGIYRKEQSEELLDKYRYDYVLGAIHNLDNMKDFYYLDYTEYDVDDLLRRYFDAELELAKWNRTDSLAHLTYPLRYIIGKYKMSVDLTKYDGVINEIFETLIRNKKALELNVSSLFNYHFDTMPSKEYIKRFHDMGGKYVTVGSDSHYADKVCLGIDKGFDILKECGYEHFTIFVGHEPWLMPLR
ncbi:MAG: PHP domain-containing protein, partial [Eubacterium sp.]|nr:PHP domain-containing protein [Eubacterium sp.]